ncbi:MAG: VWA domain-containing protein [Saccharofermentans sp.]|nr:VWA domain-containing protein [Saccharofermentans sp.]
MDGLRFEPMLPIWVMVLICIGLLLLKRKGIAPYVRQIFMVILIFIINLRPMYKSDNVKVVKQDLNCYCIFVVDNTTSMLAEDYNGDETRMTGVSADVKHITESLGGAKFAVIDFNNEAHMSAPFTDDNVFINNVISSLAPPYLVYSKGTNISVSYSLLEYLLEETEEFDNGEVLVFFMSDGENTDGNDLDSFADLAEYIDGGAVMGYGTDSGGQMHWHDVLDDELVLVEDERDYPYKTAISKIDEDNLEDIASDLDLPYVHMEETSDIDDVLDDIVETLASEQKEDVRKGYKDMYYLFAIPLAGLIAYEFISVKRRA